MWWSKKHYHLVEHEARSSPGLSDAAAGATIVSPMPGKVLRVDVTEGQAVDTGDVVAVLEAMKVRGVVEFYSQLAMIPCVIRTVALRLHCVACSDDEDATQQLNPTTS